MVTAHLNAADLHNKCLLMSVLPGMSHHGAPAGKQQGSPKQWLCPSFLRIACVIVSVQRLQQLDVSVDLKCLQSSSGSCNQAVQSANGSHTYASCLQV